MSITQSIRKKLPNKILSRRIFKATVHTTVCLIFCLIPKVRERLGGQPAFLPLISVMVHPGRRLGSMIEGSLLDTSGLIVGLAYSLLARFLAQCALGPYKHLTDDILYHNHYKRYEAALVILAVFEIIMLFYHGWMRVITHKFFHIVFPLFLVVHFAFLTELNVSHGIIARDYSIPFYLGISMSIFWNIVLFPEFGSSYLGTSTVEALNQIHQTVDATVACFVNAPEYYSEIPNLATVLKQKDAIRGKVAACSTVLSECLYEVSYSYLSPAQLKNVIDRFKFLTIHINALANVCQLEFVSMTAESLTEDEKLARVDKEIQHVDKELLLRVLDHTKEPVAQLHRNISECFYLIKSTICYCYDVEMNLADTPFGFNGMPFTEYTKEDLTSMDFESLINKLIKAQAEFDISFRAQLAQLDETLLSPSDEMFLLSSFLMNFKELTDCVISMMKDTRDFYAYRRYRESKGWFGKKLWFSWNSSHITNWLHSNSNRNETATLQGNASLVEGDTMDVKKNDKSSPIELDKEEPTLPMTTMDESRGNKKTIVNLLKFLHNFFIEYKEHFRFGLQVTIALMLASFPMFIPKSRKWYINIRGSWIGFVCILVVENTVGDTFWVFFLRGAGIVTGAAWGYLSYVAGIHQTNPYLEVVIATIGAIPGFYYFLGTPYVKAAIIGIISIYIVMLASIVPSATPTPILQSFAKRCLAQIYGGAVALVVQVCLFPVTAREQLSVEVASVAGYIAEMQMIYSVGLEGELAQESLDDTRYKRFQKLSSQAKAALGRAEQYRGFSSREPRLKGSFKHAAEIFTQIIFIERQIIDRMDNVVLLRRAYGSAAIEELNHIVFPYRRQVSGTISSVMRALQEAFLSKQPLPQFLPSARISQRRLINKVRECLNTKYGSQLKKSVSRGSNEDEEEDEFLTLQPHHIVNITVLKEKLLSWNASSAAIEEIIEYIEELVDLTKLLVGVNEFKYGFLSRHLYEDWVEETNNDYAELVKKRTTLSDDIIDEESLSSDYEAGQPTALVDGDGDVLRTFRKRTHSIGGGAPMARTTTLGDAQEELPLSLKRIVSRKSNY